MRKPWKPSVEDGLQIAACNWIAMCVPQVFAFSIANEFKCTPAYGALLNAKGRRKGMPDLQVLVRDCEAPSFLNPFSFFIEFKRPGKDLRDDQAEMKERLEYMGWHVYLVDSLDDLPKVFELEGIPTRCTSS